ncbi:MAG: Uma2 family endonuclease [Myxococcales bacterium]|nr:Uma2 family endonuclease [Myxococcales bacterium]
MAQAAHNVRYEYREYLAHERASNVKHEYLEGRIYAMAGGSPEHARIAASLSRLLGNRTAGRRCAVYSSDLRVRVLATGLATYPDVTVVCGRFEADPADPNTVVNPSLLVEVLSPSTEEYDRGEKLDHYRRIPSLQECVLVAHDARAVDVWRRGPDDSWTVERAVEGERVAIATLGCELEVADIYRDALAGGGVG